MRLDPNSKATSVLVLYDPEQPNHVLVEGQGYRADPGRFEEFARLVLFLTLLAIPLVLVIFLVEFS
jgi:hypothetical protein